MSMMIIFERDKPKNIIIWSLIFITTQLVGYVIYIIIRQTLHNKRNALTIKIAEDEVYDRLISNKLYENSTNLGHGVFEFNRLAYEANITANNHYDVYTTREAFKENLINDLLKSKKYVILELTKVNSKDFDDIKSVLIEQAQNNLEVRLVFDRSMPRKIVKELKNAGVRVYRFNKHSTVGKVYANLRNVISIDGETVYLSNLNISSKQLKEDCDEACVFLRIKGDVVQDMDVTLHKDAIFASGKYIDYIKLDKPGYTNKCVMQYLANSATTDMELALIKAICMAKKSVQMELSRFIPTESIMSLLRFAINSNIQVRLMVPLKNYSFGKYFASRAYAKELALLGANVYLYDGYINFNAITIDDEYVIYGSYIVDREHINTSPQNMLLVKESKIVKIFNEMFNDGIYNSYRINDAKFMLLREKFFKNFV